MILILKRLLIFLFFKAVEPERPEGIVENRETGQEQVASIFEGDAYIHFFSLFLEVPPFLLFLLSTIYFNLHSSLSVMQLIMFSKWWILLNLPKWK